MKEKATKKRKRKLRGWTKVAIGALSLFLVVAIVMGVGHSVYMSYYNKMNYEETVTRTEFGRCMRRVLEGDMRELMYAEHVYNVLLIGQDSRVEGENHNSDAMILVSINESTEEIIMTSFLRDSWVHIPGYGAERINKAYELGGADLLIDTIETNFRIRIDHYMAIDFFAFMDVVDALGGVEMTITDEEVENMLYYFHYEINPMLGRPLDTDVIEKGGTYVLNGAQTLAYVRCRYVGTDFARAERQRKVLNVLFERFKNSSVPEMLKVVEVALPYVTTDIDEDTLLKLLTNMALEYKDYEIVANRVPYDGTWTNWIHEITGETKDVLSIDIEVNTNYLIRDIYGVDFTVDEAEAETVGEEFMEE